MRFRVVLFDLGQTLLEYPGNTHEFWREYLERRLADMHPLFRKMARAIDGDTPSFVERAMDVVWPERKINMSGKSWHFADRMRALLAAYGREECTDGEGKRGHLGDPAEQPPRIAETATADRLRWRRCR